MLDYMPNIVYNVAGTLSNKVYILFTWLGELQSYWNSELRSSDVSWTSSMTSTTFVWTRRSEQIKSIQMMLLAKIWTILIYNPHTDMIVGHVKHTHTVFQYSDKMRMKITSKLANNNDTHFNCKEAALQVLT